MKKLLLLLAISLQIVYADILVVVSERSSIQNLDKHEVKRIFLDKTRFFPNGEKVQVVEGISENVKNAFYSLVTNKSKSQLRAYWAKQIFTGKGRPPRKMKEDKLLHYLAQNPNAISYISTEQMSNSLKVLYKIKR